MSRNLMPKSGAMAPYVVVNRDAAVAGVFSVDGEAGAVALTSKYLQISNYTIDKEELNTRLTGIDTRIDGVDTSIGSINESVGNINTALGGINTSIEDINTSIEGINTTLGEIDTSLEAKASKGANNDITELNALTKAITIAQGGTGSSTLEGAKTALELDRFSQESETETIIYSGDKNSRLTIQNSGIWGVYSDTEQKWLALPVEQGGTGVNNREALWGVVRPQGSTPLAGDPVNDYDAVTKRWVENKINTGTVGPTMNGVMNYGVGDFHLRDSRAYIQPYEVVSDGQLLNRADWPELWAYAQMLSPIADADWLADPAKRGNYSLGDGSTTFRVPDRNGTQTGSIRGLFGRGDAGGSYGGILENGLPDISGQFDAYSYLTGTPSGAFTSSVNGGSQFPLGNAGGASTRYDTFTFRASRANAAYGRASEVRPNSFVGVWVIRASGGFVAANTSWTVYNSDQTLPPANTTANGGVVRSEYQVGGSLRAAASFMAQHTTRTDGSPTASLQIGVSDGSNSATWGYKADGHITSSTGWFLFDGVLNTGGNVAVGAGEFCSFILEDKNSADADGVGKWWSWALDGRYGSYFIKRLRGGINTGQVVINMPSSSGTIALQGTSGLEYKRDIKDADLKDAVNRIDSLRMVNFVYKDDEQNRVRFGFIAEEAEQVAPQYIKHNSEPTADILDKDGNKIGEETRDRPCVDVNPIVMDLLGCVQYLKGEVDQLKAELAELKASK